ncbi:peptidase T [Pseudoclostridium thermosuccinogenes]|uniref:peptidase T n=1 Tax=Clostridium thermosuccinogenes TaxID=84032 RepID=UPI002FD8D093
MSKVVEKFLDYVRYDTQSGESSSTCPSTRKQYDFGLHLVDELKKVGLEDANIDENGYVMASLPANCSGAPVIGFIAHMDTSPDMSGANVQPKVVENYNGKDIILNKEKNIVLSPSVYPKLLDYVGQTIITTDGTTLLGADDKAGIAEIITAMEYLVNNPHIKHGTIKVCFTPDEEIGNGANLFDTVRFGADFAYTVDGGELGELEYENFNAALANVNINGINIHPGTAKNKMINSTLIGMEFNSMLPPHETPEHTEGYEGFFHLTRINGTVEKTTLQYIIRDHDKKKFVERKNKLEKIAEYLNDKYGKNTVTLEMKDQYYNMKEKIEPVMHIVETAKKAMEELGITPLIRPIRGGTDGARLSYMGLPTPNLFTGGHNFHGRFEYIPVESMEKAVQVIVKIVELYAKKAESEDASKE